MEKLDRFLFSAAAQFFAPRMSTDNHGPAYVGRKAGAAAIKRTAQKRRNQMRQTVR